MTIFAKPVLTIRAERDQPRRGLAKPAAAIELGQVRLEIDMQPLRPARPGRRRCRPHQPRGNALPPILPIDAGIEDECVHAAIPRHIDEPHQPLTIKRPDMGEAALQDGLETRRPRIAP